MTKPTIKLRVGTRESKLAIAQTDIVVDLLKELEPSYEFEIVRMTTTGDKILEKTLSKIGEKSLFTKELETALTSDEVDFVVHSLKDLPTTLPEGLSIVAILEREEPSDAVVFPKDSKMTSLDDLPDGAIVGTSSLRRIAQLRHKYQTFEFKSVRGNLNTRLRKLDEDKVCDALILAVAGLKRLDMSERISATLSPSEFYYAVGQGAIAVESRSNDEIVQNLIKQLAHRETSLRCIAERSFMKKLQGGCSVPIGVTSTFEGDNLTIDGAIFSFDGQQAIIRKKKTVIATKTERHQQNTIVGVFCEKLNEQEVTQAFELGESLAQEMIDEGARELLDKAMLDAKNSNL